MNSKTIGLAKIIGHFVDGVHNINPLFGGHQIFINANTHQPCFSGGIVQKVLIKREIQESC